MNEENDAVMHRTSPYTLKGNVMVYKKLKKQKSGICEFAFYGIGTYY